MEADLLPSPCLFPVPGPIPWPFMGRIAALVPHVSSHQAHPHTDLALGSQR